jgi:hypothetical protein
MGGLVSIDRSARNKYEFYIKTVLRPTDYHRWHQERVDLAQDSPLHLRRDRPGLRSHKIRCRRDFLIVMTFSAHLFGTSDAESCVIHVKQSTGFKRD